MLVIVHGVGLAVTGWGAGKGKGVHGTVRTLNIGWRGDEGAITKMRDRRVGPVRATWRIGR
jgi:hypothetical protein